MCSVVSTVTRLMVVLVCPVQDPVRLFVFCCEHCDPTDGGVGVSCAGPGEAGGTGSVSRSAVGRQRGGPARRLFRRLGRGERRRAAARRGQHGAGDGSAPSAGPPAAAARHPRQGYEGGAPVHQRRRAGRRLHAQPVHRRPGPAAARSRRRKGNWACSRGQVSRPSPRSGRVW